MVTQFSSLDKNKALYKLKGLPPIYYLNLDEQPERKEYMEEQFKYWEIENYTRISAYDGRDGRDLGDILKGRYPDMMSSGEVGCTTSVPYDYDVVQLAVINPASVHLLLRKLLI